MLAEGADVSERLYLECGFWLAETAKEIEKLTPGTNGFPRWMWDWRQRPTIIERMSDVTRILSGIEQGNPSAAEQLLPLIYDELRRLAAAKLASEPPGQTLQATALVHEAYLRLVGDGQPDEWNGRTHFFAAAAEAMRRILIENARRKKSLKRGGDHFRIELDTGVMRKHKRSEQLLALDAALDRLELLDPLKAQVVKLRFFAGLTNAETSAELGISAATGKRYWTYARAWLEREMRQDELASR